MGGDAVVRPAMRQSTASLHRSLSPDVQAKLPTFFIHPDAGAPINRQTMEVPLSSTGLMPWLPHPKDGPLPGNRPPFDSSAAVPTSFVTPHKSTRVPGRAA